MYRYIVNRVLLVVPTLVGAAALVFVLIDHRILLGLFQVVHRIPAHIAHRHPLLFGIFAGQFNQFLAPLLGQRRDRDAKVLPFDHRVETKA